MPSRKSVYSGKGIVGLTRGFREVLSNLSLPKGSKATFFGTPAVCLPFIELLSYAVRDLTDNIVYVPGISLDKAVKLRYVDGYGYQVGERADPSNSDVVVLLGGLAMPMANLKVEDVVEAVDKALKKGGHIVGVGFMSIFDQTGWTYRVPFTYVIDCYCEVKGEALQLVGVD
ncbi:MAG: DUF2124 family protein [Candidatus Nezhaarchaeota archaeon]|nr:DUF2124 family protein [Candidatus Nezhaarchaeota archaeon]